MKIKINQMSEIYQKRFYAYYKSTRYCKQVRFFCPYCENIIMDALEGFSFYCGTCEKTFNGTDLLHVIRIIEEKLNKDLEQIVCSNQADITTLFEQKIPLLKEQIGELQVYYNSEHARNYDWHNEHSREIEKSIAKINELESELKHEGGVITDILNKISELCEFTDGHNKSVHIQTGTHLARLPATVKPLDTEPDESKDENKEQDEYIKFHGDMSEAWEDGCEKGYNKAINKILEWIKENKKTLKIQENTLYSLDYICFPGIKKELKSMREDK